MFVGVLGLSAGVAVLAAHQEAFDMGFAVGLFGTLAICGTLWLVAWLRRAWRPASWYDLQVLGMSLAGVIATAAAGQIALSNVVLSARGELVDVVAVTTTSADEDGYRVYSLAPLSESTSLRGDLHTNQEIDDGEVVTVLADRNGFVRPMLPEDVDTVPFVIIVLAGTGFLAGGMIGYGFPLVPSRRPDAEQHSPS
jgi:hypothetical protein